MKRDPALLRDHALERQVLQAALADHARASFASLRKEFFDGKKNLAVFEIVCDMISSNRAITAQSLQVELAERNPFGWTGTHAEIKLACLAESLDLMLEPPSLDWHWAIERLGQLATARTQDATAMAILESLYSPVTIPEGDDRSPFDIRQEQIGKHLSTLAVATTSRVAQIDNLANILDDGKDAGSVPSGFTGLDSVMSIRGIPKGQITVVRAWHKGGKSVLMRSMFYRDIRQGRLPLYITFADINKVQFKRLLIRAHMGKDPVGQLSLEDANKRAERYNTYVNNILCQGTVIDAFGVSDDTSIEDIATVIKSAHLEYGFDKVYLDYAQKISSKDPKARGGITSEFDVVCRKIGNLASHLNLATIVGSQMSQGNKMTGERAKTKSGRRLEEEAGLVLQAVKREHVFEIEVVYNRWGQASVEDGKKDLVITGLVHNYGRHIITGAGVANWREESGLTPYFEEE